MTSDYTFSELKHYRKELHISTYEHHLEKKEKDSSFTFFLLFSLLSSTYFRQKEEQCPQID